MADVYIALGSNLDSPHSQLDSALKAIAQHPDMQLIRVSSRYQTPPIGLQQPDLSMPQHGLVLNCLHWNCWMRCKR